jgi:HSP20 family protein
MLRPCDLFGAFGAFRPGAIPVTDVFKTSFGYQIELELPGVVQSDIKFRQDGSLFIVEAVRPSRHPLGTSVVYSERHFGPVVRRFALPEFARITKIEALLKDGVLTLSIPINERRWRVKVK